MRNGLTFIGAIVTAVEWLKALKWLKSKRQKDVQGGLTDEPCPLRQKRGQIQIPLAKVRLAVSLCGLY